MKRNFIISLTILTAASCVYADTLFPFDDIKTLASLDTGKVAIAIIVFSYIYLIKLVYSSFNKLLQDKDESINQLERRIERIENRDNK